MGLSLVQETGVSKQGLQCTQTLSLKHLAILANMQTLSVAEHPIYIFHPSRKFPPHQTLFISELNCLSHLRFFFSCHLVACFLASNTSNPD